QDALADAHRDVVVLRLKAERAGHPAASRIEMIEIESELAEHGFLRLELHDCLVMAMALDDRLALQVRHPESIAFALNELGERHHRDRGSGKEVVQLVAKD